MVEYELTDVGYSLWAVVDALGQWAMNNLGEITEARNNFDQFNVKK